MPQDSKRTEQILKIAALTFLVFITFIVLRPFLSGMLFGIIIVVSSWPAFVEVKQRLGNKNTLTSALFIGGLVLAVLVPLLAVGILLADDFAANAAAFQKMLKERPPAPEWLVVLPFVGERLDAIWNSFRDGTLDVVQAIAPYTNQIFQFFMQGSRSFLNEIIQLVIGLAIAFFLYQNGELIAQRLSVFSEKIAGLHAEHLLKEARGTVTGVLYGVIGTAIAQGVLIAIGLLIAGVPGALFLGVIAAILSIVPMGVALVLLASAVWLIAQNQLVWAVFIIVWGIVPVGLAENIIKAGFVSRSSKLPFILILLGLLGGLMAGGIVGLFWGPVVLAVTYTLIMEWTKSPLLLLEDETPEDYEPGPDGC